MGANWYDPHIVVGWFLDREAVKKLIALARERDGEIAGDDYEDEGEDEKNFRILHRHFPDAGISMTQAHSRMEGNYDGYLDIIYIGTLLKDDDAEKFEENLKNAVDTLKEKYAPYLDTLGPLKVRGLIN
ncbi:hypothetical protein BNJ_00174 [Kaumoebavirus]|uniref:hypothetical protein n=1 Tax=Kaumoebavirus TaxID=1859492 RepID=UPI0009C3D48A|nr:hypothetical protein BNJ_00174 [Kaumoebavirus]ARA72005.1 hypothetical protein BNJ_00174 [Kaumoebavirus]